MNDMGSELAIDSTGRIDSTGGYVAVTPNDLEAYSLKCIQSYNVLAIYNGFENAVFGMQFLGCVCRFE